MEIDWSYGKEFDEKRVTTKMYAQAFGYAYAVGRPTQRRKTQGGT